MRTICIAGKNNIAVDVLEKIIEKYREESIIYVIYNHTEAGNNTWQKSLKFFAEKWGVQSITLKQAYEIENLIFISCEFDQLIKPEKFNSPFLYNIHFSLLPTYRGMYTSMLPLYNGEKESGVTFHFIDRGIDTGDIIAQRRFEIDETDTCRSLYQKYIIYGTQLIIDLLDEIISGECVGKAQGVYGATYYSKKAIDYKNIKVDLNQTAWKIGRQIRAFSYREYQIPSIEGMQIFDYKIENEKSIFKSGTILERASDFMRISTIDYNTILYRDCFEDVCRLTREKKISELVKLPNLQMYMNERKDNKTPLMIAVESGCTEIVELFLKCGADTNAVDDSGKTILMLAASQEEFNIDIFKKLYQSGVPTEKKDYYDHKVWDYIPNEKYQMISAILKRK